MNDSDHSRSHKLGLLLSGEHPCSYLPERMARTLFLDPACPLSATTYQALIDSGFRRSGSHLYRPHCLNCHACIPVRIPVREFVPRRAHRRCLSRNQGITVTERPAELRQEHYKLYSDYLDSRHPDGAMGKSSPDQYLDFFTAPWIETRFVEFRHQHQLIAVAVMDLLPNGLSAIYSFYDLQFSAYSPGVFTILWQIQNARARNLDWLYLGYWIRDCRKMNYKNQYRPLEAWGGSGWKRFARGESLPRSGIDF